MYYTIMLLIESNVYGKKIITKMWNMCLSLMDVQLLAQTV